MFVPQAGPLRLVRGTYENAYAYRCPVRFATSSGPDHDEGFLRMGFPSARNVHILEVVPVPEDLRRTGQFGLYLAYASLAGATDLFTAEEVVGIIRREMTVEQTYGQGVTY